MKKKFSTKWKASKRPGKQRKYSANAPLHIKSKMMSANISKDLRKKYGKRNVVVRKGDKVKIMRGKFRKKEGKILRIEMKKDRVFIEGIQKKKIDGSNAQVPVKVSKIQIIEFMLDDKKRMNMLQEKTNKNKGEKNAPQKE